MKKICAVALLFVFLQKAQAQTVNLQDFAAGFNWLVGFAHAPGDERLYAFRKDGYIQIVQTNGSINNNVFLNISALSNNSWNNEHGLVGLAFHPNYQANGYFYVFYNQVGTGTCTVSRFSRLAGSADFADASSELKLLTWEHPNPNHVGGCLQFGPDGYLYIAAGDGGGAGDPNHTAQNLQSYLGKILRIDVDGGSPFAVPPTNPFVGNPNALPAIWAYGLRNPWRFSFDRLTGDLWIGDVGQDEREEVNFQPADNGAGRNYGWSCMEGTMTFNASQCTDTASYVPPLFEYNHDAAECSITGGVVYRGGAHANLFGKYIFTDFCSGKLWALSKNGDTASVAVLGNFNDNDFTVLDEDLYGELYLAGFYSNKILKIKGTDCTPVALIESLGSTQLPTGGSVGLVALPGVPTMNYQWVKDGNPMAGEDSTFLSVNEPGLYTLVVTNPANGCVNSSNSIEVDALSSLAINGPLDACEHTPLSYFVPAVPGANYQWTFSGISEVSGLGTSQVLVQWGDFQPNGSVNLTLYPPNGDPLTTSIEVVIHANDLLLQTATTPPACFGYSDGAIGLSVEGLDGNYAFHWNNGAAAQDLDGLPAGTYAVTVTGAYGCTATATATLVQPANLAIDGSTVDPSPGGSEGQINLNLSGGTPPYSALWSNDLTGLLATGLAAGVYSVTVTDSLGCTASDSFQLFTILATGEQGPATSIRVFPNPFSTGFSIETLDPQASWESIEVLDALGRTWFAGEKGPALGISPLLVDGQAWPPGFYQIRLRHSAGTSIFKLLKE